MAATRVLVAPEKFKGSLTGIEAAHHRWVPARAGGSLVNPTGTGFAERDGHADPPVIADEAWAKLLWAWLNPEQRDLPMSNAGHFYPLELGSGRHADVAVRWYGLAR